jgi:hypothetical protein
VSLKPDRLAYQKAERLKRQTCQVIKIYSNCLTLKNFTGVGLSLQRPQSFTTRKN